MHLYWYTFGGLCLSEEDTAKTEERPMSSPPPFSQSDSLGLLLFQLPPNKLPKQKQIHSLEGEGSKLGSDSGGVSAPGGGRKTNVSNLVYSDTWGWGVGGEKHAG